MPTLEGKKYSSYYKNIPNINQATNVGVDATTRLLTDGAGQSTSISLSDDVLSVQPADDNSVGTLICKTNDGNNVLAVDTTNKRVLCGSGQTNALTMYKIFGGHNLLPSGTGAHMALASNAELFAATGVVEVSLGTGTDPATSLDVSAEAAESNGLIPLYWYLPDAITIMSATILMGGASATDSVLNFHLMSYDMDVSSNFGDLSNGVVVADSGTTSAVDEDVIKKTTMTNLPTDVAADKVIMATVESDLTVLISVQIIVKYHIQ